MPIRLRAGNMSHQIMINSPAEGRGSIQTGGHARSDSDTSSITEARLSNFSTVELIGTGKLNELVGFYKDQNIRANMAQQQSGDQSSLTNYDNQHRLSTLSAGNNHITIDHDSIIQAADHDQTSQQGSVQLNSPPSASSSSSAAPAGAANYNTNRAANGNGRANGSIMSNDRSSGIMPTLSSKRVIVVVDESRESRRAMLWALSHLVQRADILTLLQVLPAINQAPSQGSSSRPASPLSDHMKEDSSTSPLNDHMKPEGGLPFIHTATNYGYKFKSKASELGASLKLICTSRRPEVEVEVMIVEGIEKGPTIVNQAKKLEASILVLGQRKPSFLQRLFQRTNDPLVEYCIENAECMTLAVRKKNKQAGGYLINSRWQKNFWLLA